jgi:hypothetical protein
VHPPEAIPLRNIKAKSIIKVLPILYILLSNTSIFTKPFFFQSEPPRACPKKSVQKDLNVEIRERLPLLQTVACEPHHPKFKSSDKVIVLLFIRCHPLQAIYCWPYVIESRLNDLNYIVNTPTIVISKHHKWMKCTS